MTDAPSTWLPFLLALLLVGGACVGAVAWLLRRAPAPTRGDDAEAGALRAERQRLTAELQAERDAARVQAAEAGRLHGRLGALEAELANRLADAARAEQVLAEHQGRAEREGSAARVATATLGEREATLAQVQARTQALEGEAGRQREQLALLEREHAQAHANLVHAKQANADMQAFLAEAQVRLSGVFAELAGKVFEERGQQFEKKVSAATQQGRTDIETLLKPFADKLGEFRSRVDTLYGEEAKERSALLGAVTELKSLNQTMADSADSLTRALRGSSRVRGDWGELMLESVLRGSGLEEGEHYDKQAGTRDDEGRALRPDVVVKLPDQRLVVVDSKVNLVAWQDAMNSMDQPELHGQALRKHADGLRQHVRDLGDRNYPKALGEKALDMTIAFVPIEGALSAALGADPGLQTFAFDRKVVFASPNTLMAVLRVIDRLWTRDKSQRQALQIAEAGRLLIDALNQFVPEFKAVGKKIDDASEAYASVAKRIDGPQGLFRRGQRLTDLGVRSSKALAEELRSEAVDALPLQELLPRDDDGAP